MWRVLQWRRDTPAEECHNGNTQTADGGQRPEATRPWVYGHRDVGAHIYPNEERIPGTSILSIRTRSKGPAEAKRCLFWWEDQCGKTLSRG